MTLEFLLAFPPLLLLFLGALQLALLCAADLVVRHAAGMAARAAVVVLDDEAARYGGVPRGSVSEAARSSPRSDDLVSKLATYFGPKTAAASSSSSSAGLVSANGRLAAIQRAAFLPLSGLATEPFPLSLITTSGLAAVTFPAAPGSNELLTDQLPCSGDVTVRVTYLYTCNVPVVSALFCATFFEQAIRRTLAGFGLTKPKPEDEQGLRELSHAPRAIDRVALWLSGARTRVLRAEATMPGQWGPLACTSPARTDGSAGASAANSSNASDSADPANP